MCQGKDGRELNSAPGVEPLVKWAIGKVKKYLREYGLLGFVEIVSNKCCGFPKTMMFYPPKLDHALRLRPHTSDRLIFAGVVIDEEYSFALPASANVIVDAGANIGLASILYAKTFPKARILAIERGTPNARLVSQFLSEV
jgi:hypothetical protein